MAGQEGRCILHTLGFHCRRFAVAGRSESGLMELVRSRSVADPSGSLLHFPACNVIAGTDVTRPETLLAMARQTR
jgi:hypothetical protein